MPSIAHAEGSGTAPVAEAIALPWRLYYSAPPMLPVKAAA
jgi:hypothetical protein